MKISKRSEKGWSDFSAEFDLHKTNPFIYIEFWRQACLPSFSFVCSELFSLTDNQLNKLERCQQWFLKNIFCVPKCTPNQFLLRISNLNSTESEVDTKRFLFLGPLITEQKMSPTVGHLFCKRTDSFLMLTYHHWALYLVSVKPLVNMIRSTISSIGT